MRTIIGRTYKFESAHQLNGLEPNHKCGRLHGHSYKITIELSSASLTPSGFVLDFADVDKFMQPLIESFDHHNLNEHPFFSGKNPTSEHIARAVREYVLEVLHKAVNRDESDETFWICLKSVTVSETDRSYARIEEPNKQ